MPIKMKNLADKVSDVGSQIVAPQGSEAEGIKQRMQTKDEYLGSIQPTAAAPAPAKSSADVINPSAKYGDQGKEQRIDTTEMMKPLGSAPVQAYDCGGMVYDKGGVVGQPETHVHMHAYDKGGTVQPDAAQAFRQSSTDRDSRLEGVPQGVTIDSPLPEGAYYGATAEGKAAAGPKPLAAPKVNMETSPMGEAYGKAKYAVMHPIDQAVEHVKSSYKAMPSYDEGGQVDVNDGNHQVAVLENGERVLTPEQNAQYEAEQAAKAQGAGAPGDLGGQVLPNPKGIKPMLDTEHPKAEPLTGGAKMDTSSAKGMGVIPTPASAKMQYLPHAQPAPAPAAAAPVPAEPAMADTGAPREETAPMGNAMGTDMPLPQGKDVAADKAYTSMVPFGPNETPSDTAHTELEHKRQMLTHDMEAGYAAGTPAGLTAAGTAKLGLLELNKLHPWGSPDNHPGILGKIEHGLAKAGNIAGDIVAPAVMANVPGTDLNKQVQEGRAQGEIAQGRAGEKETAATALTNKQVNAPAAIDQQLAAAQEAQRTNPTPEGAQKVQDLETVLEKGKTQPDDKPVQQLIDAEVKRDATVAGTPERAAAEQEVARIKDAIGAGKTIPGPTLEANRLKYEGTLAKLDKAGHSTADPKNVNKAIDAGVKDGTLTADEAGAAHAFQDANSNAATNIVLSNEKGEGALERNFRNKEVMVQTPTGPQQMTGAVAASHGYTDFEAITPAIAQKNKDTNAATVANMKTYSTYQRAANEADLTDEDKRILQMVVDHGTEGGGSSVMNYIPAVGPLSNALNGWLRGGISNEQWSDMTPAAQHLATDYIAAIVGNFAQMKALGILQRNPEMIRTEMESIPKPYLPKDAINTKFESKMTETENRSAAIPRISGEESWRDVPRYKPPTAAGNTAGAKDLASKAQKQYHLDNDPSKPVVGYAIDGKYVDTPGYKAGKPITQ